MKLALLGAAAVAAGLVLGIEGLVYSGVLWIVARLSITAILASRGEDGSTAPGLMVPDESEIGRIQGTAGKKVGTWPGFAFMLAIGLGSMAIGILNLGFEGDYEYLRWLPVVVGALFTLLTLLSLPVRLGMAEMPEAPANGLNPADATGGGRPASGEDAGPKERLEQLDELRRSGLITPDEYETQRQRILGSL